MKQRRFLLVGFSILLPTGFWLFLSERSPTPPAGLSSMTRSPAIIAPLALRDEAPGFGRLLFREPQTKEEQVEAPALLIPNMRLVGAITSDERRIAVVENDGAVFHLKEGDVLEGWQVASITARAVRFTRANQSLDIPLDPPNPP